MITGFNICSIPLAGANLPYSHITYCMHLPDDNNVEDIIMITLLLLLFFSKHELKICNLLSIFRTIMAVPIVDGINWDNFAYSSVYGAATAHHRGIFEWGFLYKESQVPQRELSRREHNSEPYR